MKNKNLILILGLFFSTFVVDKIYADEAPKSPEVICREMYPYEPVTRDKAYNDCVAQVRANIIIQQNAPAHPGTPPNFDCHQTDSDERNACITLYNTRKEAYDEKLKNYQEYQSAHPQVVNETSTAALIEATVWKQQEAIDKLKNIKRIVQYVTAAGLIATGTLMLCNVFSAAAGAVILGIGMALYAIATGIIADEIAKLEEAKIRTCEQYNQVATNKIKTCSPAGAPQSIENLQMTNHQFNGTGGTSEIPEMIDPKTGKCKDPSSVECGYLVKNTPKDCFKSKNGSKISCLAGVDPNKSKQYIPTFSNGKVSVNLNGKQRTFEASDFANEASMVKAGFTPSQAKQFQSIMNSSDSVLAKNGLNAKGELIKSTNLPAVSLSTPSSNSSGSSATGAPSMNMKKDEYGPAQEVARVPASAEGLTKDYHGEKIGAEGDDVFKMINRRYILKQKQNIFLEQ